MPRKPLAIEFTFDRETKNTVRFDEVSDDDNPIIGKLYIQKSALASMTPPDPKKLTVTIS